MNPPYEFCAHKFLDLWRTEEPLHKAMSGTPSARQVRDALKHFRVARTFKGLSDEVAEKISQDLVEVSDSEGIYSDKVTSLARRFKKNFGQLNLSAASKTPLVAQEKAVFDLRRKSRNRARSSRKQIQ